MLSSSLAFLLSVVALVRLGSPASDPLVAQIQHPPRGLKLRPEESVVVRIRVSGREDTLMWSLSLRGGTQKPVQLASGTGSVHDVSVVDLVAEAMTPGEIYVLELSASDGQAMKTAETQIVITDPRYSLIPLADGNLSQAASQIYASDASGDLLLYAVNYMDSASGLMLLQRPIGKREILPVRVGSSESVRLSGDGSMLFFQGVFPPPVGPPPQGAFAFGLLHLETRTLSIVDPDAAVIFSADSRGRRIAYHGIAPNNTLQYFLYDTESGSRRQLTDDPQAIREQVGATECPQALGTRPFISADGSSVVIVTSATLGLLPPDDAVGCHVFAYNVEAEKWRHVVALPRELVVDVPTLSADGRWLSFRASSRPPGTPPLPILLDVETGELRDPVVDVGSLGGADSVITGDGEGIVISTRADLDPRVGNADHNLELFYYDFATRMISQITETIGGIGIRSGTCPSFRPFVSHDGGVVTFFFHRFSVEQCQLDGPMRHARDGLVFSFVRAVRRRFGNRGPVLEPIPAQHVVAGERLTLEFKAHDADGDPITFFAQVKDGGDVPPGSLITDHYDGTATFTWPTRPEHAGSAVLRVAAFDEGGGEVVQDVTLDVIASDRPTSSPTSFATTSPTPIATATPGKCHGDCDDDKLVTIDELLLSTSIALGRTPLTACSAKVSYS